MFPPMIRSRIWPPMGGLESVEETKRRLTGGRTVTEEDVTCSEPSCLLGAQVLCHMFRDPSAPCGGVSMLEFVLCLSEI